MSEGNSKLCYYNFHGNNIEWQSNALYGEMSHKHSVLFMIYYVELFLPIVPYVYVPIKFGNDQFCTKQSGELKIMFV